jgi:hypothetical protein
MKKIVKFFKTQILNKSKDRSYPCLPRLNITNMSALIAQSKIL